MDTESRDAEDRATTTGTAPSLPTAVDRDTFQAQLDSLRIREKAHTRDGDAIAATPTTAAPMVEVDAELTLDQGTDGPIAS